MSEWCIGVVGGSALYDLAEFEESTRMLVALAGALPEMRPASPIDTVLDFAIVTPPDQRDPGTMAKLDAVAGRVLQSDRG